MSSASTSPDNLTKPFTCEDGYHDELFEKINKLTVYVNPLQEFFNSLKTKRIRLDQLSYDINLTNKLIDDLAIPADFYDFIQNGQFDDEYQDKLCLLEERFKKAEALRNEGYVCASEVHIRLKQLSRTASKKILDYFGANLAVYSREPVGRRRSLLSASFSNFQQTILNPKASSMSFVLQHDESKKVTALVNSYTDLARQHLTHTSFQLIHSFPVPTKTKGFFFTTDSETKKSGLVRKIKKGFGLSKRGNESEVDLPHLLENSFASLLQIVNPEIVFEEFFFTKLTPKPYHSILPSILIPYEKLITEHLQKCTCLSDLLESIQVLQSNEPDYIQLKNMHERLMTRIKARLQEVLVMECNGLGNAVTSDQCPHPMTIHLIELLHALHSIESSELLTETLNTIDAAYEACIARLCSRIQNSRTQSVFIITNYYHCIQALEIESYTTLSNILEEYQSKLKDCLTLFAAEELSPYFTEILHIVEREELHPKGEFDEIPENSLNLLQEFMTTYRNKFIVINSSIQDTFPDECQEMVFKFVIDFLLQKFIKFAEAINRSALIEQVVEDLEKLYIQQRKK